MPLYCCAGDPRIAVLKITHKDIIASFTIRQAIVSSAIEAMKSIRISVLGEGTHARRVTRAVFLISAVGVGKSALVLRYVRSEYIDEYDPSKQDIFSKREVVNGNPTVLGMLPYIFGPFYFLFFFFGLSTSSKSYDQRS